MLLRRIARPLFASWFLSEGVDALRRPADHVPAARGAVERLAATVPAGALGGALDAYRHPTDAQLTTVVRAHGGATAFAALLLATGRAPRAAALALAALTLPLAAADAPASRSEKAHLSAQEKQERKTRFLRGLSLVGGALIVAADTAGRPGMRWRVRHARDTRAAIAQATAAAAAAGAGKKAAAAKQAAKAETAKAVGAKKAAKAETAKAAATTKAAKIETAKALGAKKAAKTEAAKAVVTKKAAKTEAAQAVGARKAAKAETAKAAATTKAVAKAR
jgi:uncharacterized membrane protein YphA (DoxX/SURF4 family)